MANKTIKVENEVVKELKEGAEDLDIVKWFVESGSVLRFPDQIPFKENLCTVLGEIIKSGQEIKIE